MKFFLQGEASTCSLRQSCPGAMFLDDSNLIDEHLTQTIDRICKTIKGFYFGRLDIRYKRLGRTERGEEYDDH
jgi:hypothetical protein